MSLPFLVNTGWCLRVISRRRSPAGPLPAPALPMPFNLTTDPLSTPAGIFTFKFSVLNSSPLPAHFLQTEVIFFPAPLHSVHVWAILKKPLEVCTWPVPLHAGQVCEASAPLPLHLSHWIVRFTANGLVSPPKASSRVSSTPVSMSAPLALLRDTLSVRAPKISPKTSLKSNDSPPPYPLNPSPPPNCSNVVPALSYCARFSLSPSTA